MKKAKINAGQFTEGLGFKESWCFLCLNVFKSQLCVPGPKLV